MSADTIQDLTNRQGLLYTVGTTEQNFQLVKTKQNIVNYVPGLKLSTRDARDSMEVTELI